MGKLSGRVAIITGGSRGQGEAIVRRLADEGASVVIADILDFEGEALAGQLAGNCAYHHLDVSSEEQWSAVVREVLAKYGKIDILVNNAGVFAPKSFLDTTSSDWEFHYRVNLLGVFLGMQAVAKPMIAAGGGSIVNTSSNSALRAIPGMFSYCSSKWGVRGMSKNAALDFAPHNIRVNCVLPGVIDTAMYHANGPEKTKQYDALIPLGRRGEPAEIAALIAYLVSDEATYFAGSELVLDGAVFA